MHLYNYQLLRYNMFIVNYKYENCMQYIWSGGHQQAST